MYKKIATGLLASTFFAVLISTGVAIASQSYPQNRMTLVLGESISARPDGAPCRNNEQCQSGDCRQRSFLPWIPGHCSSPGEREKDYLPEELDGRKPEPTKKPIATPTTKSKPTKKPKKEESWHNRNECKNMTNYTAGLKQMLRETEQQMQRLKAQIEKVERQANQLCEEAEPTPEPLKAQ